MKISLYFTVSILLFSCNKGGIFRNIDEKLSNNNRHWRLIKYEVNDIDSTELINFGNYSEFKENFFLAMHPSKYSGMPHCTNRFYSLQANFTDNDENFEVVETTSLKYNKNSTKDSCVSLNTQNCQRNVFLPEGIKAKWKIQRFSNRKLILTLYQTNRYYLELRSN
ncbi:MAG: hypothetical protein J0L69_14150 [Bacteroidetes bacterium]|nr:hypothetical protein [Bacteroidota bacterium]